LERYDVKFDGKICLISICWESERRSQPGVYPNTKSKVRVLEDYALAKSKRIHQEYLDATSEGTEHGWYNSQDYRINNNLKKQDTHFIVILLKSCGVNIYDFNWGGDERYSKAIKSCISGSGLVMVRRIMCQSHYNE